MGYKKWLVCLSGCLLALLLCAGGIGCFLTAFRLENLHIGTVVFWSCFITLCWGICYTLRLQLIPMCILALLAGYLWHGGGLAESVEGLLYRISLCYDSVYNCGVVCWSSTYASKADLTAAVCAATALITWAVCRTVCAGRSAWPAVAVSLLPLAACMVVTDLIPADLWLWLLLTGEVLLILPNTLRRQNAADGTCLTAFTVLPALLAVALLLWAVPRGSYRGQARATAVADRLLQWLPSAQQLEDTVASAISGVLEMDSVDLSAVGRRTNTQIIVMELSGTTVGPVYLRGQHLDLYDGFGWRSSETANSLQWLPEEGVLVSAGTLQITTRYTLPTVYVPYYAKIPGNVWYGTRIKNESKLKSYGYDCLQLRPDWKDDPAGSGQAHSSIQLPDATRRWAEGLLAGIISDGQTVAQKAEAIGSYVRTSAKYDLDTVQMPDEETDFVRWFLEDSDRGYCVHFASSAVVLLQAAGIPARYVTGYMTTLDSNGKATVRLENAHAWAEYYASGVGWVLLEATPSREVPVQLPQEVGAAETVAPTSAVTQPQAEGTSAATLPQKPDVRPGDQSAKADTGWLQTCLVRFLGAFAAAGVWLQWRLRLMLRLRRLQRGDPDCRAVTLWREIGMLSRLLKQPPPGELFAIAQRARFSQHRLAEEELQPLQAYVAEAREALGEKPRYLRLLYRLVMAVC